MSQIYSVLGRFRWGFLRLGRIGNFFFRFMSDVRWLRDISSLLGGIFPIPFSEYFGLLMMPRLYCACYFCAIFRMFRLSLGNSKLYPVLAGISSYEEIYSFLICILRFEIHCLRISVFPRFDWIESNFEWTWSTATITGSVSTAKGGMRLECVN